MKRAPGTLRSCATIVHAWLRMDFFGDPHRDTGSALTSTIFSQSFLALVLAALMHDPRVGLVPYAAANLSLSTLLAGIGALADPQRAWHRRRADAVLLHTAPLERATRALARAAHGAFYVALITIGMAIPPAVLAGFLAGGSVWVTLAYVGHACVLAGLVAGALGVVVETAGALAGRGPALLLAGTLRAVLLGLGFVGFALCLRELDANADALPIGRAGAWCWPPYWSARLLANPADLRAAGALAGALLVIGVAGASLGDRPQSRAQRARRTGFAPLAALERRLAKGGALLGATRFVAAMLYRSPSFRARVLPLFGLPIAMTALAFVGEAGRDQSLLLGMTLQLPAIYLPFLIAFLPNAERAGTGFVFATSPRCTLALAREASLIALVTRVLLPVHAAALLLELLAGVPPLVAGSLFVFSLGLAVHVAAWQLRALDAMPFTRDEEEKLSVDFGGMVGIGLVFGAAGGGFGLVAWHPAAVAGAVALAAAAAWRLTRAEVRIARS